MLFNLHWMGGDKLGPLLEIHLASLVAGAPLSRDGHSKQQQVALNFGHGKRSCLHPVVLLEGEELLHRGKNQHLGILCEMNGRSSV